MNDLSLLTWKEISEIDKAKSIVFVVLAPVEEHGYEQYGNYALYKILPLHIGFLPVFGRVNRKKVAK